MVSDIALYGLFGKKLGHSFSRKYFADKFANEGLAARYWNFESSDAESIVDLPALYPGLRGLNVTVPYKEDILPFLDTLSPAARRIGAVNTIVVERKPDGSVLLHGHNTDCDGFGATVTISAGDRVLILGTGGAAKAVGEAVRRAGGEAVYVSRSPKSEVSIGYNNLTDELIKSCTIIVNATPLGMWPDVESAPDIPYGSLTDRHLCYDLTYNPDTTEFMRRCAAGGARVKNGLDMLHAQAEAAWKIWNNP